MHSEKDGRTAMSKDMQREASCEKAGCASLLKVSCLRSSSTANRICACSRPAQALA